MSKHCFLFQRASRKASSCSGRQKTFQWWASGISPAKLFLGGSSSFYCVLLQTLAWIQASIPFVGNIWRKIFFSSQTWHFYFVIPSALQGQHKSHLCGNWASSGSGARFAIAWCFEGRGCRRATGRSTWRSTFWCWLWDAATSPGVDNRASSGSGRSFGQSFASTWWEEEKFERRRGFEASGFCPGKLWCESQSQNHSEEKCASKSGTACFKDTSQQEYQRKKAGEQPWRSRFEDVEERCLQPRIPQDLQWLVVHFIIQVFFKFLCAFGKI